MMNFQHFELMDRYARGGMTEQERSDFEVQLRMNKELATEWSDYLLIARSVTNSIRIKSQKSNNLNISLNHVPQLVADARDLAKENGLLLTDEDIWDYLRCKSDQDKKSTIEKRRANDPTFDISVEREAAIVEGIRKHAAKMRLIHQVRDSLKEEGFMQSVNEQIQRDMAAEQPNLQKIKENAAETYRMIYWLLAIFVLIACLAGVWWLSQTDRTESQLSSELVQLKQDITNIKSLQALGVTNGAGAFRMLNKDMPEAALQLISALPINKRSSETIFIEGIAYVEKGDYPKAITVLQQIDTTANKEIQLKAMWMRALCHKNINQNDKSRDVLKQLIQQFSNQTPIPPEVTKAKKMYNFK
jgi:tetratricopeptide (TPR) repeat protein